jgi:hypothetical protein
LDHLPFKFREPHDLQGQEAYVLAQKYIENILPLYLYCDVSNEGLFEILTGTWSFPIVAHSGLDKFAPEVVGRVYIGPDQMVRTKPLINRIISFVKEARRFHQLIVSIVAFKETLERENF